MGSFPAGWTLRMRIPLIFCGSIPNRSGKKADFCLKFKKGEADKEILTAKSVKDTMWFGGKAEN